MPWPCPARRPLCHGKEPGSSHSPPILHGVTLGLREGPSLPLGGPATQGVGCEISNRSWPGQPNGLKGLLAGHLQCWQGPRPVTEAVFPAGPWGTCLSALCSLAGASGAHLTKVWCGLARDSPMGSGAGSVSPPLALSWGPPTAGLPPCLGGRRRGKAVPPVTSARILPCGGHWEPTIAGQVRSLGCGGVPGGGDVPAWVLFPP